jgi:hypothetical protein
MIFLSVWYSQVRFTVYKLLVNALLMLNVECSESNCKNVCKMKLGPCSLNPSSSAYGCTGLVCFYT